MDTVLALLMNATEVYVMCCTKLYGVLKYLSIAECYKLFFIL